MSSTDQLRRAPFELYGPLLAAVQERGILGDGKAFVDAVALRPTADIMADFSRLTFDDAQLLRFVKANFNLPNEGDPAPSSTPATPLREHIKAMWSKLARPPSLDNANSSALPIAHRHIVPGGRFREIYYWDSFFTMLGLMRDGEVALATGIVEAMTDMIEAYGHVPNGTRTYYLGRSQPPVYYMMVDLLGNSEPSAASRRLAALKREHAWWMNGADALEYGQTALRVVKLEDGSLLNRYWDPRHTPRDESWGEDVATAARSSRPKSQVYQDLRAGAESGWDFSSRWLDNESLSSIRTTTIVPVDLNAFLFGLECAIAKSGDCDAERYEQMAANRRVAMNRHLWNADSGYFADYDITLGTVRTQLTAAALTPLLVGAASQEQADQTAAAVEQGLLAPGGLNTTQFRSGQQWDRPNGWAPLQWIAVTGLLRFGHEILACEIAGRWIDTVSATFARTGLIFEKYDVEAENIGSGGEYETQTGFGWTNGVTADFIDRFNPSPVSG